MDKVMYLKMVTGEDLIATVDNSQIFDDVDELEIIEPFVIRISKSHGFYEYSAVRWGMFLSEKHDQTFYVLTKHILIYGDANQQAKDMYDGWINESTSSTAITMSNNDSSSFDPDPSDMNEDELEAYKEMYREYLKKVH
jgi:hypothetical protein